MRSTFGGFNTVVRGLNAHQVKLDTLGHNIANVNTEGYSRQRVNLETPKPQDVAGFYGANQLGSGVGIASITRARDHFVDQQFWKENSTYSYGSTVLDGLSKVEGVFQEPSSTGVQTVMNKFWESWQTLSVNAADYASRTNVKARGMNVVNAIQQSATQLKNNIQDTNSVIGLKVKSMNEIVSEIAALNRQIVYIEHGTGDHANDLRDKRDDLTNKLSSLSNITVNEDSRGNYNIQISGQGVVNGSNYTELSTKTTQDPDYGYQRVDVYVADTGVSVDFTGGEMKGLIQSRDDEKSGYKGYLNQMSLLSQYFLTEFNSVHRAGMGTDDTKNNNFFGDMSGADGQDYDYKNDPEHRFDHYTKGDWLKALCTNPVFATTDGLGKIAAKTSNNSDVFAKPVMPDVTTSGAYTGAGESGIKIISEIDATSGAIKYYAKLDGTTKIDASLSGDELSFKINGMNVKIDLKDAKFDDYQYNIGRDGKVTVLDTTGRPLEDSKLTIKTEGEYTGGNTSTELKVTRKPDGKFYYSVDGATEKEATVDGRGNIVIPETIKGQTITINVDDAKANGTYVVLISKSNNASGDNAVNLANFMKNETVGILGNTSLETYYAAVIADLGVQTQNMDRLTQNQDTLVGTIVNQREGICGVSVDEEMTDMIKFQKGYNAAARVMTAMDEMLDKLINSTGVVGR